MCEIRINSLTSEAVRFFGRTVAVAENQSVFFNWSGSGFAFRFTGTQAKAYLLSGLPQDEVPSEDARAYIGVYVDGSPYAVSRFPLDQKEGWYPLAEGLNEGEHTIYVIKETEVGYGRAAVSQLAADGAFLEPPSEKKNRLEFIGDSITCGYGNISSNENPEFVTREEEFSLTYAALTARMLDMELTCVAASGNGFFHDYGCQTHNLIPSLYLHTDKMFDEHRGKVPEKWDFAKVPCAMTVIKLGQNDAQYCLGADLPEDQRNAPILEERRAAFEQTAAAFLQKITECRPDIPILLLYEADMVLKDEIVRAAKHISNIHLMEIVSKRPWEGVGANGHWSRHTHARIAALLAERIREILCLPLTRKNVIC